MSDMEQSDVVAPEVPAAEGAAAVEPVAPEQSEAQAVVEASDAESVAPVEPVAPAVEAPPAADPAVEAPVSGPVASSDEDTQAKLKAELESLLADVEAREAAEAAQPPVPVVAKQPSSDSETQQPEAEESEAPFTLEEAARVVVTLVRAHRTIGDTDLDAAISVLDAEFPPPAEPEADEADAEQA